MRRPVGQNHQKRERKPINVNSPKQVLQNVNTFFNKLSKDNYKRIIGEFLSSQIFQNERHLDVIINNLIDRAEHEGHYLQEVYAIFCKETIQSKQLTYIVKRGFHQHLLESVQAKFRTEVKPLAIPSQKMLDDSKQRKAVQYGVNIMCFIGELFNRDLVMNSIIHHIIKNLLFPTKHQQNNTLQIVYPTEAGIELIGSLFYVSGKKIEESSVPFTELFFAVFDELLTNHAYSNRTQFYIEDLIEYRKSKWTIMHREQTYKKALSEDEAREAYQKLQRSISEKAKRLRMERLRRLPDFQNKSSSTMTPTTTSSTTPTLTLTTASTTSQAVVEPTVDDYISRSNYHIQSYLEEPDEDPISEILIEMPSPKLMVYIATAIFEVSTTLKSSLSIISPLLQSLLEKFVNQGFDDRKMVEIGYTKFLDRVFEKELFEDYPSLFIQTAKVFLDVLPDGHCFLLQRFDDACCFSKQISMLSSIMGAYLHFLEQYASKRRDTVGFYPYLKNLNVVHFLRGDLKRGSSFISYLSPDLIFSCQALSYCLSPSSTLLDSLMASLKIASEKAFTSVFSVFVVWCSPKELDSFSSIFSFLFRGPSSQSSSFQLSDHHFSFLSELEHLHVQFSFPISKMASFIHSFCESFSWLPLSTLSNWLDHHTHSSSTFSSSLRQSLLEMYQFTC